MATTLAQLNPSATTLTALFTAERSTSIEGITVVNSGANSSFRLSLAIAGEADSLKQYIYYDQSLNANNTLLFEPGFVIKGGDIIRCYAGNASMAFQVFGVER